MANIAFGDFVYDDAGAAVNGATVNLYARNTTTPVLATVQTDSNGYWSFSHGTEGRFDVEIVNQTTKRRIKYDTEAQMTSLEVANLRVRNPADTFKYDLVPAAITADRSLTLPLTTGADTLACLGLSQNFSVTQYIGDTANAKMTLGLTLNQGAADNEILALKSSDVAHEVTGVTETDTYAFFQKPSGIGGGLRIWGLCDADAAVALGVSIVGVTGAAADTTHTAAGRAVVELDANLASGTGTTSIGANGNLLAAQNYGSTKFLVDAEGDLFADGSDVTVYDEYDDALMLRAFDLNRGRRGIIESEWDKFVHYNEQDLVGIGILGAPRSQGGLINYTLLARFQNGAIWQLAKKLMEAERRLELAEKRLAALPAGGA